MPTRAYAKTNRGLRPTARVVPSTSRSRKVTEVPMLEVARSDEDGESVRHEFLGDLKPIPLLAPVTKATGLSCITNLP
jgi:hypothetical protein